MNSLGVWEIVKHRAVFIPTQTTDGHHGRHKFIGIRPVALGIDQTGGDIQAGALRFAEIAFVQKSIRPESLAGQGSTFVLALPVADVPGDDE